MSRVTKQFWQLLQIWYTGTYTQLHTILWLHYVCVLQWKYLLQAPIQLATQYTQATLCLCIAVEVSLAGTYPASYTVYSGYTMFVYCSGGISACRLPLDCQISNSRSALLYTMW